MINDSRNFNPKEEARRKVGFPIGGKLCNAIVKPYQLLLAKRTIDGGYIDMRQGGGCSIPRSKRIGSSRLVVLVLPCVIPLVVVPDPPILKLIPVDTVCVQLLLTQLRSLIEDSPLTVLQSSSDIHDCGCAVRLVSAGECVVIPYHHPGGSIDVDLREIKVLE